VPPTARPPTRPPGPAVTATAAELSDVAARLIRRLRDESDFPAGQLRALGRLEREGAATTSRLAAGERVRPQSMAQTVAELVADDLVSRRPDPDDGRQVLLEITPAGRAVLARERAARTAWLADGLAGFDDEERAVLVAALVLLRRVLDR
jgi:DNA-binding MarR family transcriptional regulator